MDDAFLIPDEWLSDIRGVASREADGKDVTFSRKALKGLLARLDVSEKGRQTSLEGLREYIALWCERHPCCHKNEHADYIRRLTVEIPTDVLDGSNEVVCACGLETTLNCLAPGGSHYGHTVKS